MTKKTNRRNGKISQWDIDMINKIHANAPTLSYREISDMVGRDQRVVSFVIRNGITVEDEYRELNASGVYATTSRADLVEHEQEPEQEPETTCEPGDIDRLVTAIQGVSLAIYALTDEIGFLFHKGGLA